MADSANRKTTDTHQQRPVPILPEASVRLGDSRIFNLFIKRVHTPNRLRLPTCESTYCRIVTAGRMPIRPHPKHIRIQNSDGWAFLTSVSAPRFPIQRVTGMGFLDRGQSKVTALSCSTAFSFRPSLRPRKTHAISLGQHHFYSCAGPLLTVAPRTAPIWSVCSAASAARGRPSRFCDTTPIFLST